MKKLDEMSDRELLEFIFGAQVQLMRKINRIERHLGKEVDIKEYMDKNEHLDEVYENMLGLNGNFSIQISKRAEEDKEE
ncbi:hypothetical protein GCM10009122_14250 [Fulvivirga kasyanovii]|uniref:Uncharacterized protein n=1 Tax=Fulvivirga kasyanovii TaxID=396812 RepID=A0ABW9RIA0_9BACT|nr:hypothetical protein [Fulvivirga kasyanovii]MTI23637.1 hypothetical protein [Fulvivirga kasyanovii]